MALGRYCQLCGEAKKVSEIMAEAHGVVVNVDCLMSKVYGDPPTAAEQVRAMVRFCRNCGAELPPPRPETCPRCQAAITPLLVEGQVPSLETRLMAFLIDTALVAVLAWLGRIALGHVVLAAAPTSQPAAWELWTISSVLSFMVYHTLFAAVIRATPGKLIFGLRLLLKDGSPRIGLFRALLRSGLYLLTLYVFPLGLILMFLYEPRENWRQIIEGDALFHNPLTDTVVIKPR